MWPQRGVSGLSDVSLSLYKEAKRKVMPKCKCEEVYHQSKYSYESHFKEILLRY